MSTDPSAASAEDAGGPGAYGTMPAVTVDPGEAGPPPAPGPPRRARRSGRRGGVPALVVALVLSLTAAGLLGWKVRGNDARSDARAQAVAAAQVYAVNLTTYDHETLEQDFARVIDNSTGSFRAEYTAASQDLRELIVEFEATATGRVISTGVVRADTDSAEVILFVDQTVENTNTAEPRIDRSRMQMSLVKRDGRWLINSLDLI